MLPDPARPPQPSPLLRLANFLQVLLCALFEHFQLCHQLAFLFNPLLHAASRGEGVPHALQDRGGFQDIADGPNACLASLPCRLVNDNFFAHMYMGPFPPEPFFRRPAMPLPFPFPLGFG